MNIVKQYGIKTKSLIRQSVYENYKIAQKICDRAMEDYWGYILESINERETK